MSVLFIAFESLLLALSCSVDAFAASFAYGTKGIKIPLTSVNIINLVCGVIFGFSLWCGAFVRQYLPGQITVTAAFAVLFFAGIIKLADSITKTIIRRYGEKNNRGLNKEITFSMMNFNFILILYANPERADVNENKIISPAEAAALAVSLSLDGVAVGFGAAIGNINIITAVAASLIINAAALYIGCRLGNKLASKLPFNFSWLSGVMLIGIAVSKLF